MEPVHETGNSSYERDVNNVFFEAEIPRT